MAVGAFFFFSQPEDQSSLRSHVETPYKLRWVIAHYPERYFVRMAN